MSSFIKFQDNQIHYTSEGQGRTIVLLHGFLESTEIWNDFSTFLSSDFYVISIDLPGHGKSSSISEIHSMDLMAKSVKAVLDHLKIETCILIGHSMGGYVTLAFAEKYPKYLCGFGLFHSQAEADSDEAKTNRDRTVAIVEKDRTGFIQNFIPGLFASENVEVYKNEIKVLKLHAAQTSKEGIIAALMGMKERTSKLELLKMTKIPVLFIIGKQDKRIPTEKVLQQAALPYRSEIIILGNVGHMGYIEAKKETLKAVGCFAEKCNLF